MRHTTLAALALLSACMGNQNLTEAEKRDLLLADVEAAATVVKSFGDARTAAVAQAVLDVVGDIRAGNGETDLIRAVLEAIEEGLPELQAHLVEVYPERSGEIATGLLVLGALLRRLAAEVG